MPLELFVFPSFLLNTLSEAFFFKNPLYNALSLSVKRITERIENEAAARAGKLSLAAGGASLRPHTLVALANQLAQLRLVAAAHRRLVAARERLVAARQRLVAALH